MKLTKNILTFTVCLLMNALLAQNNVGIGTTTPEASAALDISATNKGLLIPRVSLVKTNNILDPIPAPATGLLVYNTNANVTNGSGVGFYMFDGAVWQKLVTEGETSMISDDNGDTYIDTKPGGSNPDKIEFKMGSNNRKIIFDQANSNASRMYFNTPYNNTIIGKGSGENWISTNYNDNVIIGKENGNNNRPIANVFIGSNIAKNATSSSVGTSRDNVILGTNTASTLGTGDNNVLLGYFTGELINAGSNNIMLGAYAGQNSGADRNIFIGYSAGRYATLNGGYNIAIGSNSGRNIIGQYNVFIGDRSGYNNVGSKNVMLGYSAGYYELGSDKLYIENTSSTTPLIYGNFADDTLRVNGTFNINKEYSFPAADGNNNQVLTTNGNGQISWTVQAGQQPAQVLSKSGNNISLSGGGGTVNLPPQTLSLSGSLLTLSSGGGTVDVGNIVTDNLGNHSATQNIHLNNNYLSNDGDNEGIQINNSGDVKIGNGNYIGGIIKVSLNKDLPSISGNDYAFATFGVTGAQPGATVLVSPQNNLPAKVNIAHARVSSAGTVQVKFNNPGNGSQNPSPMNYFITVINP